MPHFYSPKHRKAESLSRLLLWRFLGLCLGVASFILTSHLLDGVIPMTIIPAPEEQQPGELSKEKTLSTLEAVLAYNDCSIEGFSRETHPRGAVVLRGDRLLVTSFEQGWAAFHGETTGTLVAPCLQRKPLPKTMETAVDGELLRQS